MKKTSTIAVLLVALTLCSYAQKKVAVITFYINKQINVSEFGDVAHAASIKLSDDSLFNLKPLLKEFHQQFFDQYATTFPFQLLPEDQVTGNDAYKNFTPVAGDGKGIMNVYNYLTPYDGYKVIIPFVGHGSEKELLKVFNQCDGVMVVYIDFKLVKIGLGGMGVVKVMATANMRLINKDGDKVFSIEEDEKSKSVSPLVAGVQVMSAEKILPMCESALSALMDELPKALPKIIKKTDAKL
jgi:hypothetical protein